MKAYRMVQQLRGGLSVVGSSLSLLMDWGEVGHGGAGLRVSALHPKVLCELLDLQQIFSVDCGTGGGQRAQHVRLQREQRYDLLFYFFFYNQVLLQPVNHLPDFHSLNSVTVDHVNNINSLLIQLMSFLTGSY